MKLHVNRKMAEEDDDYDDKKKEQESAEAISGLKILIFKTKKVCYDFKEILSFSSKSSLVKV